MKGGAHNEGAMEGKFVFKGRELFLFVRFASRGQTSANFPTNHAVSKAISMENYQIILGLDLII